MTNSTKTSMAPLQISNHLARLVLVTFILTFIVVRVLVILIMSRRIPDLYLHLGGTHVHHLNYGIFLLAGVGAYQLFWHPSGRNLEIAAIIYGSGMALTFDEFGMWLHLGGPYWQRASLDAITVISAVFGLIAFAPSLKRFHFQHWAGAFVITVAVGIFFFMLLESFKYVDKIVIPVLQEIETTSPP
ncbi:MAG: hypothetical protein UZ01_01295 [Candidatus Brocadia sinica]|nr:MULTISPECIES: hypothetical protein [Brocadia]KXK30626.1 MAG: hypothetical protein UZ01_01295 [Candidatus Brocadia sinica]MCK6468250.1 hypothetical protein [Candidatus Brocadia sinica]